MNEHLLRAVQSAYGDAHFLTCVIPNPQPRCFPRGVKSFLVEHESRTCGHLPCCHWYTCVYEYRGHYTGVKTADLAVLSVGDLVDRVTRAIEN